MPNSDWLARLKPAPSALGLASKLDGRCMVSQVGQEGVESMSLAQTLCCPVARMWREPRGGRVRAKGETRVLGWPVCLGSGVPSGKAPQAGSNSCAGQPRPCLQESLQPQTQLRILARLSRASSGRPAVWARPGCWLQESDDVLHTQACARAGLCVTETTALHVCVHLRGPAAVCAHRMSPRTCGSCR